MGNRTIKRYVLQVAAFLLICLGVLSVYVVYLQSVAADGLAKNPLNQRSAQAEADVQRGSILDSEGRALAQSTQPGNRSYPMGESMAFVTGYFSEEIGSSGIEGYANRDLLGITEEVMRMGPIAQLFQSSRGNDVCLTIDSDAQQAAFDGLAGRRGAVVVLDVDTGAVLALVSSPSYDPNYLAGEWEAMLDRESAPADDRFSALSEDQQDQLAGLLRTLVVDWCDRLETLPGVGHGRTPGSPALPELPPDAEEV